MFDDKATHKNLWISSWVLTIALLGDALLYILLPVYADEFGLSIVAVGFLLAINRVIRTFTYGFITAIGQFVGVKNLALAGALFAAISTLGYGLLEGVFLLGVSRVLWGLSYAALLIVTLHYASINPQKIGTRIGISRSVEQIGPMLVMACGTFFVSFVGPQDIFILLGLISCIASALALCLTSQNIPEINQKAERQIKNALSLKSISIPRPALIDGLIFWMGFGIDGVFTVTISLMWAQHTSVETAILLGGLILAGRRAAEMLIAPQAGFLADKFGVVKPLLLMLCLSSLGFLSIGLSQLILGSMLLVVSRGALGTLYPAAASALYPEQKITALTRNQTHRDIGAATGPVITGFGLVYFTAEQLHVAVFVLCAINILIFICAKDFTRLSMAFQAQK